MYFLPWLLLFPFARFSKFHDEAKQRLARALSWGIAVPFVGVNLVPGAVARYSMPAIVPASWLLAMICAGNGLQWPVRWRRDDRDWAKVVATFVSLWLVIGAIGYPVAAIVLKNRQQVKKAAAEINALMPPTETLYAVDPDYLPVLFYINTPVKYVSHIEKLPADTHYFLVRAGNKQEAATTQKWAPRKTHKLTHAMDYTKREMTLFRVGP
jgi:hypothetical protein